MPYLVKDIFPGPSASSPSSNPQGFLTVGSRIFFNASDGYRGRELWVSDGTAAGTRLVKDINPGAGGSNPQNLVCWGATIYFAASDGTHGMELWKSDGTAAGTVMVKDLRPGSSSSTPANLIVVNGILFFTATDDAAGTELWRSDGTAAGTVMVEDIQPGSSSSSPNNLTAIGTTLFFAADDGATGTELWKSDGTAPGTVLVKDIHIYANSYPQEMIAFRGQLYFQAGDQNYGSELWKSDGTTAGTVRVTDLNIGPNSSFPAHFAIMNNLLYFSAFDGVNGSELWCSDGTETGTAMVKNIVPDNSDMIVLNNYLYFTVTIYQSPSYGYYLYRSDGTVQGTVKIGTTQAAISEIIAVNGSIYCAGDGLYRWDGTQFTTVLATNAEGGALNPLNLTVVGNTLYFNADSGSLGLELWKSDGTPGGTVMVRDINHKPGNGFPTQLTDMNSTLYFSAIVVDDGRELWRSDGTTSGTWMIRDIYPGDMGSDPQQLTVGGDQLFFSADDGVHGREVWASDGSASGTLMLKDIKPGKADGGATALTWTGGKLFFLADDGVHGQELWASDGTASGTLMLLDIVAGPQDSAISDMTGVGGTLLFNAAGNELWRSDGTTTGTFRIAVLYPADLVDSVPPPQFWQLGGVMYFLVTLDHSGNTQLMRTDGTASGTFPIFNFTSGYIGSSHPFNMASMGDSLYFFNGLILSQKSPDGVYPPYTYTSQLELRKTDGATSSGTAIVKTFAIGNSRVLQYPPALAAIHGNLFFLQNAKLWASDGTSSGTVLSKSVYFSNAQHITPVAGGNDYFTANDGTHGQELWTSNGASTGTLLVKDIIAGTGASNPDALTDFFGSLYFTAYQSTSGAAVPDLFKSDGTAAGTVALRASGSISLSDAHALAVSGHRLFFAAAGTGTGTELFAIALDDPLSAKPGALRFTRDTAFAVDVEHGGKATTQTLTIKNDGAYPIDFLGGGQTPGLTLTGANAKDFLISRVIPSSKLPLAPGASMAVTVKFLPGEKTRTLGLDAALEVATDSAQTPRLAIPLEGDAVPVGLASFRVE